MQVNVKITDLLEINKLDPGHLFLVSQPIYNEEGAYVEDMPYTSNSISAASLSSNIKIMLENDVLSVKNRWHFPETVDNVPTQGVKLETDDIIDALNDSDKLSSIIDDEKNGWYKGLSSSTLQNRVNEDGENQTQSISVSNDSIPNIDFVQRIVAQAYQLALTNCMVSPVIIPSYVGEIIHSTVLSSREMVREKYGDGTVKKGIQTPDTYWIQHKGYFLRGVAEGGTVTNNSPNSDGGQDSKLYDVPLKDHEHQKSNYTGLKHNHGAGNLESYVGGAEPITVKSGSGQNVNSVDWTGMGNFQHGGASVRGSTSDALDSITIESGKVKTDYNAEKSPQINVNHIPAFKSVYIWERIL